MGLIPTVAVRIRHGLWIWSGEEVDPELGDYLVIPHTSVPEHEILPAWVVRSDHVEVVHVVKPRLGEDRVIEPRRLPAVVKARRRKTS